MSSSFPPSLPSLPSRSSPAAPSRYRIITGLGHGGMGEVFLAARTGGGPNDLAVIKRIWPELADEPDFVAMFVDEARLALRLAHRNVVETFEVGRDLGRDLAPGIDESETAGKRGRYFLAMEYLPGQPLSQIVRRLRGSETFSLQLRLEILVEVLRALEYAHDLCDDNGTPLGIVHRDISPDNIFVTYAGEVKLMDFGVAKSRFASHETRPGVFKGRFTYAAPEQVRGHEIDGRADLFAIGVILWELLTERRMFRGRSETEVRRLLAGHEPLPALPESWPVPAGLRRIVTRALALEPRARYQSANKLRRDLTDVLALELPREPRPLGGVVARAFRAEKQAMEWLIERHFRGADPFRTAAGGGKPTRLGREERPREVSGLAASTGALPPIWSSFALAPEGLAPVAVAPGALRGDSASFSLPPPPPPRRTSRTTDSAMAVEIGDRTIAEAVVTRPRWRDRAAGGAALAAAVVLGAVVSRGFEGAPRGEYGNARTAHAASELLTTRPQIEPIIEPILPAPAPITPPPPAPAPVVVPAPGPAPQPIAAIKPATRPRPPGARPPVPSGMTRDATPEELAEAAAPEPTTVPRLATRVVAGPPTLDIQSPYSP